MKDNSIPHAESSNQLVEEISRLISSLVD